MVDRDVVDLSLHRVMELHHRAVSREQLRRFEGYLAEIFAACGLNLNTPATEETPRRFLQALGEGGDTGDFDEQATKAPKAARMVKGSSSAMPPGKEPRP